MRKKCGGFIVDVVNDVKSDRTLVFPLYGVGPSTPVLGPHGWFHMKTEDDTAYWVFNNFLKELDDDTTQFQVGDIVRAAQCGNHGFIGRVMGFELDGGVVCRSLKYEDETDRRRFTYNPKDLRRVQKVEYKAQEALRSNITVLAEDSSGQLCMVMVE